MIRKCENCGHGPNPNRRLFPSDNEPGCKRMAKIDSVFEELTIDMQDVAEELATGIVIFLQKIWREEDMDFLKDGCPGFQP
tara:strand:- start:20635 stop:20877 length:243 start_codon:yes stop_codon:yes gene_type:complete